MPASTSADDSGPIVQVSHLSKRFRIYHQRHQSLKQSLLNMRRSEHEDFWALRDVSFDVHRGETFGIIGHNGSGKSTLLKCLTEILQPDEGSVSVNGSVSALLELGAGFHPELSGRENIFLNAAIIGVPRRHIEERFDDIVAFSGLEQFIDTPVKNYSSGMFVRLGFAVAVNVDPDVLIIDEVLSVGDAEFQAKCGDKIAEFRERGKTIVLVTHSTADVTRICQRAAWIDHGTLRMVGSPEQVTDAYLATTHEGRAALHHEGTRWGSGEVRVECVDLLDRNGDSVPIASTGEPLTIRVRLLADQPVSGPELAILVHDQAGTLVSEVSTRDRGYRLDVVEGSETLALQIDSLPLSAGTYELSSVIRDDSGQRELDVWNKFLRFDVMRGQTSDGGLVSLGGAWASAE